MVPKGNYIYLVWKPALGNRQLSQLISRFACQFPKASVLWKTWDDGGSQHHGMNSFDSHLS